MRIGESARLMQSNQASPTRMVESGAGMRKANVGTPLTAEELKKKKSREAKLRALEASRGARREAEERAKREAEEAVRRETEGERVVGIPGQWKGGWRVMPASEQERAETGWFPRNLIWETDPITKKTDKQ